MRLIGRVAVGLGSVLFATVVVLYGQGVAQNPPTGQQPSFKTATVLVQVDVIVTDRNRAFVADLRPGDFEVLEDGVPQKVEQVYLALDNSVKTALAVVPPGARPSDALRPALPTPAPTDMRRTFVLLFDTDNIQAGGFNRAREAALRFVDENFRPGDIGGVVHNGVMANNRLTEDRSEIATALKGLQPSGESRSTQLEMRAWPRLLDAYEIYLIAEKNDPRAISTAIARACSDDPDACKRGQDPPVVEKARQLIAGFRLRAQNTVRAIRGLVTGLRRLPGRKTIILMTDGFLVEDEWANLRQITDEANRSSVRIYSIDTRGLNRGSASSDIIDAGPRSAVNPASEAPGSITGIETGVDGPNSLAVDTGGMAVRNENDFGKALREVAADTSSYYVLGYRTTNSKLDGKFRAITVRVARKGVTVRARKGYVASPDLATTSVLPADPGAATPTEPNVPPPVATTAPPQPPPGDPRPTTNDPRPTTNNPPPTTNDRPPTTTLRLQPDVKDRVATLGKLAPDPAKDARNRAPDNVMAKAREGWEAYQRGDVRSAESLLAAAAAAGTAPPWVHYTLGWSRFAQSKYPEAAGEWETVRSQVPEFAPVYFDLADTFLQQQDFGKALLVLREAEKRWPNDVEVYNAIGVVQTGRYAFGDAIKTFEKAVSVKADDPTANYNLARVCELRLIQSQRLHDVARSVAGVFDQDKNCALQYYRRTVDLGTLFVEEAKAGLRRVGQQ